VSLRRALAEPGMDINRSFRCAQSSSEVFANSHVLAMGSITLAWSESLLDLAIEANRLDMVQFFVESGVDLEAKSSHFKASSLFIAIAHGHEAIANYLIDKGANVNYVLPRLIKEIGVNTLGTMNEAYCNINPRIFNFVPTRSEVRPVVLAENLSILHLAAQVGVSSGLVSRLLDRGADTTAIASYIARTPAEHIWQSCCTSTGVAQQVLGLLRLCLPNIRDLFASCFCPGIHAWMCGADPMPVNIDKLPWQVARDFGHDAIKDMLQFSTESESSTAISGRAKDHGSGAVAITTLNPYSHAVAGAGAGAGLPPSLRAAGTTYQTGYYEPSVG